MTALDAQKNVTSTTLFVIALALLDQNMHTFIILSMISINRVKIFKQAKCYLARLTKV